MRVSARCLVSSYVALFVGVACTAPAFAGERDCRIAISKENARFIQSKSFALQRCRDRALRGIVTDCSSDPKTLAAIADATDRAHRRMLKGCCGNDLTCGGPHDFDPGWGAIATCPNFESGSCTNTINNDPSSIADCAVCVGEAATDQLIALMYVPFVSGATGDELRCQRRIGRETVRFYRRKSHALQKCWEMRFLGRHNNDCPDPGDGRALGRIALAETGMRHAICRDCGGSDRDCGGGDDLALASIGTAPTCPNVTVPNDGGPHAGESCARSIATVQDLVDCLVCVAEFKVDCVDDLGVPEFESYSANCNATP